MLRKRLSRINMAVAAGGTPAWRSRSVQRRGQEDAGALAGSALDGEPPADQVQALPHAEKPETRFLVGGCVRRIEARPRSARSSNAQPADGGDEARLVQDRRR